MKLTINAATEWWCDVLLAGSCVWLFIATVFKMPVSGTHSIVGATVGFALVAHGAGGVDWKQFGLISKFLIRMLTNMMLLFLTACKRQTASIIVVDFEQ